MLKVGGGVRFHSLGGGIQNILVLELVDAISALLFSMVAGFAVAITIFSVRQTSHRRVPHVVGCCKVNNVPFISAQG